MVCASCGTQIKAGRAYCLRCGEELPVEGQPVKVSIWESLELSQSKLLILLAVVFLVVLALVLVIWQNQPPPLDDIGRPVTVPRTRNRAVPPAHERWAGVLTLPGGLSRIDSSRY